MGLPRSGASSCPHHHHHHHQQKSNITTNNSNNRGEKRNWAEISSNNSDEGDSSSGSNSIQSAGVVKSTITDPLEPPTKLLCTSPPHGLCAEDVPQQEFCRQISAAQGLLSCFEEESASKVSEEEKHSSDIPNHSSNNPSDDLTGNTTTRTMSDTLLPSDEETDNEDDRDFMDDEEDKDSGFIDSNSIDNSSDDEMDVRIPTSGVSSSVNNNSSDMCESKIIFSEQKLDNSSQLNSCFNISDSSNDSCRNNSISSEISISSTSSTLNKLSISSIEEESVLLSSSSSSSSSISLPSCSSAFSSLSQFLSSESVQSDMDVTFVPTSIVESSPDCSVAPNCSSEMCYTVTGVPSSGGSCSSSPSCDVSNSIASISEALSTSIALSVDLSNASNNNNNPLSSLLHTNFSVSSHQPLLHSQGSVESATVNGNDSSNTSISNTNNNLLPLPSISTVTRAGALEPLSIPPPASSDCSNVTIQSGNSDTIVTSAYPGTVSTPIYDPHNLAYQPTYPSTEFSPRASTGASTPPPPPPSSPVLNGTWSCSFYDGNQPPVTNKYMEIQIHKIGTSPPSTPPPSSNQAIQCDANGKSYMDLGSTSPYTQTYSNDCANYTTSPSNFSPQSYSNQPYNNSTYSQQPQSPQQPLPNQYYRPNYSHYSYPSGENYPNIYEGESGYSGYHSSYSAASRPSKIMPRCGSPFCDPSKSSSIRSPCFQQQRLTVLNMSICKLNRFNRVYADKNLHKTVRVWNTIRLIEKELESEGTSMNQILSQQHMMQTGLPPHCPTPPPPPLPQPPPSVAMLSSEGPLPPMHSPILNSPCTPPPTALSPYPGSGGLQYPTPQYPDGSAYDELRLYSSPSSMLLDSEPISCPPDHRPLPQTPSTASPLPSLCGGQNGGTSYLSPNPAIATSSGCNGIISNNNNSANNNVCNSISNITSTNSNNNSSRSNISSSSSNDINNCSSSNSSIEERHDMGGGAGATGSINWSSVLSLSSQTDIDSLNSSDYCDEWSTAAAATDAGEDDSGTGNENVAAMELEYNTGDTCDDGTTTAASAATIVPSSLETSEATTSLPQWKLPSLSADDVLKSFRGEPNRREATEDLDSLINVLVES